MAILKMHRIPKQAAKRKLRKKQLEMIVRLTGSTTYHARNLQRIWFTSTMSLTAFPPSKSASFAFMWGEVYVVEHRP